LSASTAGPGDVTERDPLTATSQSSTRGQLRADQVHDSQSSTSRSALKREREDQVTELAAEPDVTELHTRPAARLEGRE